MTMTATTAAPDTSILAAASAPTALTADLGCRRTATLRTATRRRSRTPICLAREPLAVRMGWTAACSGLMALLDLFRAAIADQTPATAVSIARHRPIVRSHAAHAPLGTHSALINVVTATARHATCLILQIAGPSMSLGIATITVNATTADLDRSTLVSALASTAAIAPPASAPPLPLPSPPPPAAASRAAVESQTAPPLRLLLRTAIIRTRRTAIIRTRRTAIIRTRRTATRRTATRRTATRRTSIIRRRRRRRRRRHHRHHRHHRHPRFRRPRRRFRRSSRRAAQLGLSLALQSAVL